MLNSRRSQTVRADQYDEASEDHAAWAADDDPMAELVRIVDADIRDAVARGNSVHDEIASALEYELSMPFAVDTDPADGNDGRGAADRGQGAANRPYDPWDDDALAALPDDFMMAEASPHRVPEGVLPPHSPAEESAAPRRSRLSWGVGLAALLVAGIGGAVYVLFPGGMTGEPQLVRAPEGPYKVIPEAGDAIDEPVESQAVFNTANGIPPKSEERLVTRDEVVPDLPGVTQQVERVILPDGKEIAAEPVTPADTGPRRVRTVLVKPDGTIIDSPDGPVPSLPSPTQTAPFAAGGPLIDPNPVAGISSVIEENSSAGLPPLSEVALPDLPGPAAVPPTTDVAALEAVDESGMTPDVPPVETAPAAPIVEAAIETPVAPVVAPTPKARPAAPQPAATSNGPLDLAAAAQTPATAPPVAAAAPPAPAPAAAAPSAAAAAYVQVASQRSEADASSTFAALQRRYPALLGNLTADIQRADLGAKGIYYRIRVPQPSRQAATDLCSSLKSAGGDCLVVR